MENGIDMLLGVLIVGFIFSLKGWFMCDD